MSILEFMKKLDYNLTNSLNIFNTINDDKPTMNINELNELKLIIQKNNRNLYKYLENIKKLETSYLSEIETNEKDKFVFGFNVDSDLYNQNFKDKFKNDMQINITSHKLKIKKSLSSPPGLKSDNNTILDNISNINKIQEHRNVNLLDNKDISPNLLNLPVIKDLKNMAPMFYWYDGDNFYKKGIYICLSKGFYSRVPFPNMISTSDPNFKINSIPCKHLTKAQCDIHKRKISEIYNSDVRECYYVHKQEKFVKIGSSYRCNIESFGSHNTLNQDMNYINISDIKRILMHSLSDSLLSVLWYQNKFKDGNLILNNLETY